MDKVSKEAINLIKKLRDNKDNIIDDLNNIRSYRGIMQMHGDWIWYIFPTNKPETREVEGDKTAITNNDDFLYILSNEEHLRIWSEIFYKINSVITLPYGYKQAIFMWNDWGRIFIFLKIWDYYSIRNNLRARLHTNEINSLDRAIFEFKENFINTPELKSVYYSDSFIYDGKTLFNYNEIYNEIYNNELIHAFYIHLKEYAKEKEKERDRKTLLFKNALNEAIPDPDANTEAAIDKLIAANRQGEEEIAAEKREAEEQAAAARQAEEWAAETAAQPPGAAPGAAPTPAPAPAPAPELFRDVLKRLITINAHGGKTSKEITVPDWAYVMIPHYKGTSQSYTTPDANKDKLYEQSLYENSHFNYSHGWKLYKPNDKINDIKFTVLSKDCNIIDKHHTLQQPLITYCKKGQSFENYCTLYCTKKSDTGDNNYELIRYNNKNKIKIKACGPYKLSDVFNTLKAKLQQLESNLKKDIEPNPDTISSDNPILLIPFTCNHDSSDKSSEEIKFAFNCNGSEEEVDETPLHTYFMNLYNNNYTFESACKKPNFGEIQYTPPVPVPAPAPAPKPDTTVTTDTTDTTDPPAPAAPAAQPPEPPAPPEPAAQPPEPPAPAAPAAQPPEPAPEPQVNKDLLTIYGFFLGDKKYHNPTIIGDYKDDEKDIFNHDLLIDINDDYNVEDIFPNHFEDNNKIDDNNSIYIKNKINLRTILDEHLNKNYTEFKIINYYMNNEFKIYSKISIKTTETTETTETTKSSVLDKSTEYINKFSNKHTLSKEIITIDNTKYYNNMLNNYLILLNLIYSEDSDNTDTDIYLNKFYENIININNYIKNNGNNEAFIFNSLKNKVNIFNGIDNKDKLKENKYEKLLELTTKSDKIQKYLDISISFIYCMHVILNKTDTIINIIDAINDYITDIYNINDKLLPYQLQLFLENKLGEKIFNFLTLILSYFNVLDNYKYNLWYLLYVHNIINTSNNYYLLLNYIDYNFHKKIIAKFEKISTIENTNFKNCIDTLGNNINNFKNNYNNNKILRKYNELYLINNKTIKDILIKYNGLTIDNNNFKLNEPPKDPVHQRDINIILNYIFPNFTKGLGKKNIKLFSQQKFPHHEEHMIYDPYFYYKLFIDYIKDNEENRDANNDIGIIIKSLKVINQKINKQIFTELINKYNSSHSDNDQLYQIIQPLTRLVIFLELFNIDDGTNTSIIDSDSTKYIENNINKYSMKRKDVKNVNKFFPIKKTIIKWRPIIKNIIELFKEQHSESIIINYFDLIDEIIKNVNYRKATPKTGTFTSNDNAKINFVININNIDYYLNFNDETVKKYPTGIIKYISLNNSKLVKYYKINNILSQTDNKVEVELINKNYDIDNLNEIFNSIKIKFKNNENTYYLVPFKFNKLFDNDDDNDHKLYIQIENFADNDMFILCYINDKNSYLFRYNNKNLYFIFKKTDDYYYYYNSDNKNIDKKYYVDYVDMIPDKNLLKKKKEIKKKTSDLNDIKKKIEEKNTHDKFDKDKFGYYVEKLKYNKAFIDKINVKIYEKYIEELELCKKFIDNINNLKKKYETKIQNIYSTSFELNKSYIDKFKTTYQDYLIKINEVINKLNEDEDYKDDYIEKTEKKFIDKIYRFFIYAENNNIDLQEAVDIKSLQKNTFIDKFFEYDDQNQNKLELEKFLKYANQHENHIIKIEKLISNINTYYTNTLSKEFTSIQYSGKNINLKENLLNYENMIDNYKKFMRILNEEIIIKLRDLIYKINVNKKNIDDIDKNEKIISFEKYEKNYKLYQHDFNKYMIINDYIIDYYNKIKMFKNVFETIKSSDNKFIIKFNKKNYEIIYLLNTINRKILEYNEILDSLYLKELGIDQDILQNEKNFDKYFEVVKKYLLKIENISNYSENNYIIEELKQFIQDIDDDDIKYNIIKETFKNKLKMIFIDKKDKIDEKFKLLKYNKKDYNIESDNLKNIDLFINKLKTLSFDKRIEAIEKYVFKKKVTSKQYNYLHRILSGNNLTLDSLIKYYQSNIYN